jgi:hypothetical protein
MRDSASRARLGALRAGGLDDRDREAQQAALAVRRGAAIIDTSGPMAFGILASEVSDVVKGRLRAHVPPRSKRAHSTGHQLGMRTGSVTSAEEGVAMENARDAPRFPDKTNVIARV